MSNKLFVSILVLGVLLPFGCMNNSKKGMAYRNGINPQEIDSIQNDSWCEKCHCKDTLIKNLTLYFDCDNEIPQSNDNVLFIIREGVLYKGNFKNKIELSVCFCLDNNLTKINSLNFALVDKRSSKVFYWSKKQSYYFFDKNIVYVKLGVTDEYEIKFDNEKFYK
jgi:hypothetical protein